MVAKHWHTEEFTKILSAQVWSVAPAPMDVPGAVPYGTKFATFQVTIFMFRTEQNLSE
jgi:hypothetical protein